MSAVSPCAMRVGASSVCSSGWVLSGLLPVRTCVVSGCMCVRAFTLCVHGRNAECVRASVCLRAMCVGASSARSSGWVLPGLLSLCTCSMCMHMQLPNTMDAGQWLLEWVEGGGEVLLNASAAPPILASNA